MLADKTLLGNKHVKFPISEKDMSTNDADDEEQRETANVTAPELRHDVYRLCQYILRKDSQRTANPSMRRIAKRLRRQGFKMIPCSDISDTAMQTVLLNAGVWSQLEQHVLSEPATHGRQTLGAIDSPEQMDEMQNWLDNQAKEDYLRDFAHSFLSDNDGPIRALSNGVV